MTEIDFGFISRQLDHVLSEQRNIRDDLREIKTRLTALKTALGLLFTQVATLNNRLDHIVAP